MRATPGVARVLRQGVCPPAPRAHARGSVALLGDGRHACGACHGITGLRWPEWEARCHWLVNQDATRQDKAGTCAQRLAREGASRWALWMSRVEKRHRTSRRASIDAASGGTNAKACAKNCNHTCRTMEALMVEVREYLWRRNRIRTGIERRQAG